MGKRQRNDTSGRSERRRHEVDALRRKVVGMLAEEVTPPVRAVFGRRSEVDARRVEAFAKQFLWPYARATMLLVTGAIDAPDQQLLKAARRYRDVSSRKCLEDRLSEEEAYRKTVAEAGEERVLVARLMVDGVEVPEAGSASVPPADEVAELIADAFVRIAVTPNKGHAVDGIWDGVPVIAMFAKNPARDAYEALCEDIVSDVESRFMGRKTARRDPLAKELRELDLAYAAMPDAMREDIEASTLRVDRQILPYDAHERRHDLAYLHGRKAPYSSSCLRNLYGEHLLERREREKSGTASPKVDEGRYEILKGIRKRMVAYVADRLSVPVAGISEDAVREYVEEEYGDHAKAFAEYANGFLILPPPRRLTQPVRVADMDMPTRLVLSVGTEGVTLAEGRRSDAPVDSSIRGGARGIWDALRRQLSLCSDEWLRHMFRADGDDGWRATFDWDKEDRHRTGMVASDVAKRVLRRKMPTLPLPWKWAEHDRFLERMGAIVENAYAPDMGFALAYATGALQRHVDEAIRKSGKELSGEKLAKARRKRYKSLAPRPGYYDEDGCLIGVTRDGDPYPWGPEHALSDLLVQLRHRADENPPSSPIDEIGTARGTMSLSLLPEDVLFVDMTMEIVSGTLRKQRGQARHGYGPTNKAYAKAYDRMMARHFGKFDIADLSEAYAAGKWHLDGVYGVTARDRETPSTLALYPKRYVAVRYEGGKPVAEFRRCVRSRERFRR